MDLFIVRRTIIRRMAYAHRLLKRCLILILSYILFQFWFRYVNSVLRFFIYVGECFLHDQLSIRLRLSE
jgi:hypothetical protein